MGRCYAARAGPRGIWAGPVALRPGKAPADPNNIQGIGSFVFSPQANKGTSSAQANLAPGQYVAADLAPAGQPPLTTFVITKSQSPAKLPKPQATVSSIEFAFRGSTLLHDGELARPQPGMGDVIGTPARSCCG